MTNSASLRRLLLVAILVTACFVTLCLEIECPLTHRLLVLFLGEFEILPIGSTFRFTRHSIIVGLKNAMNEGNHFGINFSVSTTVVIAGKQTKKATSIAALCLSIPLLPALSGP